MPVITRQQRATATGGPNAHEPLHARDPCEPNTDRNDALAPAAPS